MILTILSAILLIASFPKFDYSFFAFIGFVPLFFALQNESRKKAFFASFLCGFLFYLGVLHWLTSVTLIGTILLCLYLALYFGIFGWLFTSFAGGSSYIFRVESIDSSQKRGSLKMPLYILLLPLSWVTLEYIQSNLFTGFGWTLLGYSQYENLPLIQIADTLQVYGVSFVIMMVNVTLWTLLKTILEFTQQTIQYRKLMLFCVFCSLLCITLILTLVYDYGFFRLNEKEDGRTLKLSVIQGNILQEEKWNRDLAERILNKYILLTKSAALDKPDLVIWPETSFPGFLVEERELTGRLLGLVKELNLPLLLGTNVHEGLESFNSSVLISRQAEFIDRYDKLHLVPFGEYVPFSHRFPIFHKLVLGELGEFTQGTTYTVFKYSNMRFSALICFEDIFPELAKEFVRRGAEFLVVITNDAWYGESGAAYQHAACSVFRAIENRVPVVRCANTGYSCFIDSKGRIYDSVEVYGKHLFVTGHRTASIRLR